MGKKQPPPEETPPDLLDEIIRKVAVYPLDAYEFVQEGLQFTVQQVHGVDVDVTGAATTAALIDALKDENLFNAKAIEEESDLEEWAQETSAAPVSMHVTGQQLSLGLRDYAWMRWGLMARTVLARWNVTSTMDFGKIVYAMIEAGLFTRTDGDSLDDFKSVFDFRTLDTGYVTPVVPPRAGKLPERKDSVL